MEPNKERIEAWVAALESDEMQGRQIKGSMGSPSGRMCAGGVAAEVCERQMLAQVRKRRVFSLGGVAVAVAVWYGLDELIGEHLRTGPIYGDIQALPIEIDGVTKDLWQVNDLKGKTFREIAQLIRKQYL